MRIRSEDRRKRVDRRAEGLRKLRADELGPLRILSEISHLLNESDDLEDVLGRAMDSLIGTLGAERGFVMIDRGGDEPEIAAASGLSPDLVDSEEFGYSRSVVAHVLREGEAVLSDDASEDPRFVASPCQSLAGTRSIVCVPMRTASHQVGVVYLDNRVGTGTFSPTDLEVLQIIADMAAVTIERSQYYAQVVQAEKMSALGVLVASIAHDLNNPLATLAAQCEMLADEVGEQGRAAELVERMSRQMGRCTSLVGDLLRYSRQGEGPRKRVRMAAVVQRALDLVADDLHKHGITVSVVEPEPVGEVEINEEQWLQVLINLFTNARQALAGREDGRLVVRMGQADGELSLVVADNGPGIPPSMLRKVFEPFYTTRPNGQGTGLGLAITHQIVTAHGGRIQATHRARGGGCFLIHVPLA